MPAKLLPSYITEEYYTQNQNINYNDIKNIYNIFSINDIIETDNIQDNLIIINNNNVTNEINNDIINKTHNISSPSSLFSYIYDRIFYYII